MPVLMKGVCTFDVEITEILHAAVNPLEPSSTQQAKIHILDSTFSIFFSKMLTIKKKK